MQADRPKQYLKISTRTILETTLNLFLDDERFEGVMLAVSEQDPYWPALNVEHARLQVCHGGATRSRTVLNALNALEGQVAAEDWIWVHDAARPLLRPADIQSLRNVLSPGEPGALMAVPVADTLKRATQNHRSTETVDRSALWRAQTPQVFPYASLRQALAAALDASVDITDEASAMEWAGVQPLLVPGGEHNLKITRPQDLDVARLHSKEGAANNMSMRIGQGFDVHAFCDGTQVMLGGVSIPHNRGLKAHSDGDVLLHALCDAMLGALALGDIGHHFPDNDPKWKGANSLHLTEAVSGLLTERGWRVANVDSTIIAESPKMAPHIKAMRERIAGALDLKPDQVSVKATTSEKLGFTGRKEGIACQATVLITRV